MRKLALITYNIEEPDDPRVYDDWIRAHDYPAFRQNPHILEYHCYRIVQSLQGQERFTYADLISADFASLRR